jgi:hypothetical protein
MLVKFLSGMSRFLNKLRSKPYYFTTVIFDTWLLLCECPQS